MHKACQSPFRACRYGRHEAVTRNGCIVRLAIRSHCKNAVVEMDNIVWLFCQLVSLKVSPLWENAAVSPDPGVFLRPGNMSNGGSAG
jgi:hypothetical protein